MHLRDVFHKIHSHANGEKTKQVTESSMHHSVAGTGILLFFIVIYLTNCQKGLSYPGQEKSIIVSSNQTSDFSISVSKIVLYQNNENTPAFTCNWSATNNNPANRYTIEAASYGTDFADPVELVSTQANHAGFTVKEANQFFCTLVPAGQTDMVELRLVTRNENNTIVYSKSQALQVSTYENYVAYSLPQFMHVPGNFQNWNITDAPHIVTRDNNGEFEAYINFTNSNPQFLLLKDMTWNPINTYTNIGAGKFGFNGKMFSLSSGAGIYLMQANTNTNNWNARKINSFGLSGTAVTPVNMEDPKMVFDSAGKTWSITTVLQKGSFRIRANNSDAISFGKNKALGYVIPDYNGPDFIIDQPGNYTVVLNLHFPGDYFCTVARKSDKFVK